MPFILIFIIEIYDWVQQKSFYQFTLHGLQGLIVSILVNELLPLSAL